MARTESQRERSMYRKTQRMLETTHGGFAGKSIMEMITDELDLAVERYLDVKGNPDRLKTEMLARGEVRGLARALVIFAVPTYRDIKQCERAAVRRVKEKRNVEAEEQPEADAE